MIIPTYNAAGTIAKCLNTITDQSYPCVEIIVIDNFSDDATATITKTLGAKVFRQSTTPVSARSIGITHSNGR